MACLYDARGAPFAIWQRAGAPGPCPPSVSQDRATFQAGTLDLVASGFLDGKKFGSVFLQSDTAPLTARLRLQVAVTVALLMVAMAVALVLSSHLQHLVSRPLLELARTAAQVSARGDYSLRAQKMNDDELGALVDAFNAMLHQIQRREAELREASRLKDEFLATLSHELRTPLNAILGWTRLLRTGALPAGERDRALEKVERNAHAQARLVEDLLEVSRIASGKLRLELRPVDLAAIIHAAVESIRPAAEARRLTLETTGLDRPLPSVGDPDRLQQVIWNLLSNAVKFTPAGGHVWVTLSRHGGSDTLTVRDTGVGIDPAFVANAFDTFRQADASSTRQHGGLGLGLSIARRLVELHGGTIDAVSEGAGRGSTFTVQLPARTPAAAAGPAHGGVPRRHPAGSEPPLSSITTLVVDDEPDSLELLVSVLERAGARVLRAASADEALRLAVSGRPHVLISDIAMPGADGYTLMEQIRATLGAAAPQVTIALSAYAGAKDRERSAAAGFQRHLAKPLDPLTLVETVTEMLSPSS
jgi:signal transduction histidine kinase/CheY-like chemotaxis protein